MPPILLLLALQAGPAVAACPQAASTAALSLAMEDAEVAYARVDVDAFHDAMDHSAALLPCLEDLASADQAARYHRLQGLRAWILDDRDRAELAFLAARRIEPAWRFPAHMVPERHPTRDSYLALPLDHAVETPVVVPDGLILRIDGRNVTARAESLPALVQVRDDAGALYWSVYQWPGEPLPPWPETPDARRERHPARAPLLVTSLLAAGGSGAMMVLASQSHARWEDPSTPTAELDGLAQRTNGLLLGAGGAGALALVTGIGVATTF